MRQHGVLRAAAAILACWLSTASVRAAYIAFELTFEYSGATPPAGTAPWLTVEFDDFDSPGSVTMTLTATNLTDQEFVTDWRLNLDPLLDATDLVFSAPTKTGTFADPVITTGTDFTMAPGDGNYDILVAFANAPPGDRFGAGEAVQYVITGIPTLTATSFAFLSTSGGNGPYHTAAKVQGIGPMGKDSGNVTNGQEIIIVIPEPAGIVMSMLLLPGLTTRRRRYLARK